MSTMKRKQDRLERVHLWHVRAMHERQVATSSLDMRDWEIYEAGIARDCTIAELSAKLGLTHQALYKASRRGSTFREPPLPF